jgi:PKD repeat protein
MWGLSLCPVTEVKAQCATCPAYDFSITPTAAWQTTGSSINSYGCKVYRVAVQSGLSYAFKTGCGDGATASYDTYLELYDASCGYLAGNDDACENLRSRVEWSADYTGFVYLLVRGYSSDFGSYTVAYRSCDASALFTYGTTGTEVTFTASSIAGGNSYLWDFGDGTFGTGPTVVHDFPCGYASYVTLTVTSASGCSVTNYAYVQPEGGITAFFTYVQEGSTLTFSSEVSGTGVQYFWNFGDGSTSDEPNPVHEYVCGGDFWISLDVTDGSGECYAYHYDYAFIDGLVITPTFTYSISGSTVTFTATAPDAIAYQWDFGNGDYSSEQNPVYTYPCAGSQYVSLMVTDASGCVGYHWDFFEVGGNVLPTDFTYAVNGLTASFTGPTGGGINEWYWYFGDGNTSSLQNPTYTFACPGTYYVEVSVSNAQGCFNYGYQQLTVGAEAAPFTYSQTGNTVAFIAPSSPGVVAWYWDFGTGATSSQQNPVYTFPGCGTYYVALYRQLSNGCDMYSFQEVYVQGSMHVEAMYNGPICPGQAFTLTSTSVQFAAYQWQGPNGFASDFSTVTISNATVGMSDTYTVTIWDAGGCPNSASVEVLVDVPSNAVTAIGATLHAVDGMASYYWTDCSTGISIPAQTAASFSPVANGSYSVTVTNSTGCTATSSCVVVNNVGVDDAQALGLSVYPNPSTGIFRVDGITGTTIAQVSDVTGRSVWRGSLSGNGLIDLSAMPSGIFLLQVTTGAGSGAYRLVKQ